MREFSSSQRVTAAPGLQLSLRGFISSQLGNARHIPKFKTSINKISSACQEQQQDRKILATKSFHDIFEKFVSPYTMCQVRDLVASAFSESIESLAVQVLIRRQGKLFSDSARLC